ncbi:MAG: type II secretion system F family protein [Pirellulales bacterium]|nr:type II secretion system F family protein [Pirellulales bacterium]
MRQASMARRMGAGDNHPDNDPAGEATSEHRSRHTSAGWNQEAAHLSDIVDDHQDDDEGLTVFARRVRKTDLLYATNQMAVMVESGVTLAEALAAIIDQEENPTLRRVLTQIRREVESGNDFSAALAEHPKIFDHTYISLIRASEATGMLGEMLGRIGGHLNKEIEARRKVRAAMIYPCVMFVMAIGVTIFLLTFVLPKFMPLFEAKGVNLPIPTKVMLAVSHVFGDYWMWWTAGTVTLLTAFFVGKQTEPGGWAWDTIKLRLPIVGGAIRKIVLSRSVRTLGVMVQAGVPVLDALKLTSQIAGNRLYEEVWLRVMNEVTAGKEIHTALLGSPLFPSTLVRMIASGEETGKLDQVLQRVSDFYDQEVETSVKAATGLIEPIMIGVMGIIVGGIGLGLLLPIFSLSSAAGH